MADRSQRSNKEAKKPKKEKPAKVPFGGKQPMGAAAKPGKK